MFVRRLTIWFLVFVTSGVVGLAVPKTGYGLEICTSLKCVDRGRRKVEGVERKKKALLNPRKQTTSSRRSRDSRDSTIIRLRFQKHNFKATGDANYNDIKTTSSETASIIWDRIGLAFQILTIKEVGTIHLINPKVGKKDTGSNCYN